MSAGAIGGAAAGAVGTDASSSFAELSSGEFINILITELSNQDPFEPQDTSALLEQLSSLRNIESQISLQTQIENLVLQNQIATAGGLIGKVVTGLNTSNLQVNGLVTAVRVQDGKAILELESGSTLSMDRVTRINDQAVATPATLGG